MSAGRYRRVATQIHSDSKVRSLSSPPPNGQSLWLHLLTGRHTTNVPGLWPLFAQGLAQDLRWPLHGRDYVLDEERMAFFQTGRKLALAGVQQSFALGDPGHGVPHGVGHGVGHRVPHGVLQGVEKPCPEGLLEAFEELVDLRMAFADWNVGVVWLPNALKHNLPPNPDALKGWLPAWIEIPECPLKSAAYHHMADVLLASNKNLHKTFLERFPTPAAELSGGARHGGGHRVRHGVGHGVPHGVRQDQDQDQDQDLPERGTLPGIDLPKHGSIALVPPVAARGVRRTKAQEDAETLETHRPACERLWAIQDRLRSETIPGARTLRPTEEGLLRIAHLLAGGETEADCEHVLRVYAAEARSGNTRWFDGLSNWRPDNFARAKGRTVEEYEGGGRQTGYAPAQASSAFTGGRRSLD
jgi:hypothetical protein